MDLTKYEITMSQGLFRDTLESLQLQFGPYKNFIRPELSGISARCLTHLGMDRTADAIIYNSWRRQPGFPESAPTYLSVVHRRQGAVIAWQTSKQLLKLSLSDEQMAHLLCEQAIVVLSFRDFSLAEKILNQAKKLSSNPWILHNEAYMYFSQDRYDTCFKMLEEILGKHNHYRPSRQLAAHLLVLKGKLNDAVNLLKDIAQTMQSTALLHQLLYLHLDLKQYDLAQQYMDRLESMYYHKNNYTTRYINYVKADVLCSQQRYEEALPYFEEKYLFHRKLSESIKTTDSRDRRVLDVPFIRQHHMTCAPASMTAIARFWGTHYEQSEIIQAICYDGTPAVDERRWANDHGWLGIEFVLEFNTLKTLIDKGIPVLLSTVEPGYAHLQILVGYDNKLGLYFIRDPYHPRLQEMLVEESHKYYASSGPRCMLMVPEEKEYLLQDIHLKDKLLFDKNYLLNKALDENNRKDAVDALISMQELDKNNSLTIKAHRAIAIYDNDEPLILNITEQLLDRYPEDVNYQLSKVSSLSIIGSYHQSLSYLQLLCEKPYVDFLLKSRLANELVRDHRQRAATNKILRSLIRARATDANTLKVYADYLWTKTEYKLSYEIYRFLTCLDDKAEQYASSFFAAARYFNETEQALQFLIERCDRHSSKSSGPVISLFQALNSLDRTQEGLDYLEKSIEAGSKDGDLIIYASRQYYYINNIKRSVSLLEQAKPFVNHLRYEEMAAQISEFEQHPEQAIRHWQNILDYEPLNESANTSIVRLLYETGKSEQADRFINEQLIKFPENYLLLKLKLEWCCNNDLLSEENIYRSLIKYHQDNNWAHKKMCKFLIHQFRYNEALQIAKEAISVRSDDSEAYCVLGHVYREMAQYLLAVQNYRKSIQLSCDCVEAYKPLLDCVNNAEQKRQQLQFIYDQLMEQVTFGDALLEFQWIAGNWYSSEELLRFLNYAVEERPDLWQSWVALATKNRELGNYEQAHSLLDKAIQRFPLIPRLYMEKAEVFYYMNDLHSMEKYLNITLEYAPDWHVVINRLSEILEYQNRIQEAIDLLNNLIHKSPLIPSPYAYLADLLWRVGKKQQAMETLLHAVELSPSYYWAWNRLGEMCDSLDQCSAVLDRIKLYRKKLPDNLDLARIHAKLVELPNDKKLIYEEFLALHPKTLDMCVDYIQFLVNQAKFSDALYYCDEKYWGGNTPIEIQANRAWVIYEQGNTKKAIQAMRGIVENDPNYYEGWRLLVRWYEENEDSNNVLESIKHCQRLYPNDANVLCYVAETLEKHTSDEDETIVALLKQAYFLEPTSLYNGLTYVDKLIGNNNFDEAQNVLHTLKINCENESERVMGRELSLYCKQNLKEKALVCWQNLITSPHTAVDLITYAWNLMDQANYSNQAGDLIAQLYKKSLTDPHEYINPFSGEFWAYNQINKNGIRKFEKILKKITIQNDYDNRVFEGYMRSLVDQKANIDRRLFKKNYHQLHDDLTNWSLIAYIKAVNNEWLEIINWMKDSYQRNGVEQRTVYFYMLSLRQIGLWNDASRVTAYALGLPRDNYFDEVFIWNAFDQCLLGNPSTSMEEILGNINVDALSSISQYIYALTKALMCLNGSGFIESYSDISSLLRISKRGYASVIRYNGAKIAHDKTRAYLKQSINTSLMKSIFWKWRLSILF